CPLASADVDRDLITSRFSETPFSESFTSWAARLMTSSSVRSQSASRSITQTRVVGRGRHGHVTFRGLRPMQCRRFHVPLHVLGGATDPELLEEKTECLVVLLAERRLHVRRQIPKLLLERTERF